MVKDTKNTKEEVEKVLDKIRPAIKADGGDVELIEVKGSVVKLKLKGACATCPMSDFTLKLGIESELIKKIPEIKEVKQV